MAEEVGSAFVSLIPSARGFSRVARRELRTALAGVAGDVPLNPDVDRTAAARAGRQASATAERAAPPIQLGINVDRNSVRRALLGLSGLGQGRGLRLNVGTPVGLAAIAAAGSGASAALAGLASAGAALIPILGQLVAVAFTAAGALAAIPGGLAIAAAAVGTLIIGSLGLGEALKTATKEAAAGGQAASQLGRQVERAGRQVVLARRGIAEAARGVELAERGLATAQRAARQAQEDLNRARADARENLEDLSLSLARARLDEESAVLAVAEAQQELARTTRDPRSSTLDIRRANLAYRESEQTLVEVRERLGDLAAEQAQAARQGVEGSDQVQEALRRQADAELAAQDAAHELQQAQVAAADAAYELQQAQIDLALAQQQTTTTGRDAAAAMAALSPAGRALVQTLLGLRSAWESLQRAVQQRLFVGVAAAVQRLATVSMPTLRTGLVGIAAAINGVLLGALAQLSTQAAQVQLASIFTSTRTAVDGLSVAIRPLLQALLDVAAVGADVVAGLFGPLGERLAGFAARVSQMAASGELRQLILDGLDALKLLGSALLDIGGIIRGVFTAAGQAGGGGIFGFLSRLNELVNSVAGQDALGTLFVELGRIGTALQPVLLAFGQGLGVVARAIGDIAVQTAPFLTQFLGLLANALASLAPGFIALGPSIVALGRGLQPLAEILANLVVGIAPGVEAFLLALGEGLGFLAPMALLVGQALGEVLKAVAPLLPALGVALAGALSALSVIVAALVSGPGVAFTKLAAELITAWGSRLLPVITLLGQQLLPIFASAGERILAAFEPLIPVVQQIATLFATNLAAALPRLVDVFGQLVLAFADMAGPIGQALLDIVLGLVPRLPEMADSALALALALTDVLVALTPLLPGMARMLGLILQLVTPTVLRALTVVLVAAASALRGMSVAANAIRGPLVNGIAAVTRFRSGVSDRLGGVLRLFRNLPGRIVRALGSLGNTLWRAGRNLIQGLVDGIWSMTRYLFDTLQRITNFLPDWKGPLSRDLRILRPSGRAVLEGFRRGVLDEVPAVERTLDRITAGLSGQVAPASGGSAPAPRVVVDGTGLPRALAEWLRESVTVQGGGSVQRFAGQRAAA